MVLAIACVAISPVHKVNRETPGRCSHPFSFTRRDTLTSFHEKRAGLIADAKAIAEKAQDERRPLTPGETERVNSAVAEVRELDAKKVRAGEHAATLASLTRTAPGGATGHLALTGESGKSLASSLAARMRPEGAKALLPAGSIVGDVPIEASPVSLGYVAKRLRRGLAKRPQPGLARAGRCRRDRSVCGVPEGPA